jgi:hypothetical protein
MAQVEFDDLCGAVDRQRNASASAPRVHGVDGTLQSRASVRVRLLIVSA